MNGAGTIWCSQVGITDNKELKSINAKVFLPGFMKASLLVVITLVFVVEGQTDERRSFGRF